MLVLLALACTPSDPGRGRRDAPIPTDGSAVDTAPGTGDTAPPEPTVETDPTTTLPECQGLPDGSPPTPFTVYPITTTEDFDFDGLGYLVYSDGIAFNAADTGGWYETIAPGIFDTRGIQILDDGDIVAAYPTMDMIGVTDRLTGASYQLITGVTTPNGLDVGAGNRIYVTEASAGRVRSFDFETREPTPIADGFLFPNGLALNDAEDVVYVADYTVGIWRVPKNADGTWGPKELLFNAPATETFDAVEVDVCGNVYTVGYSSGELYRFDPETGERVLLVDINVPNSFIYNSIRWGSGRGDWRRDVLYVTNRNKIVAVDVGVDGRRHPVDAMP